MLISPKSYFQLASAAALSIALATGCSPAELLRADAPKQQSQQNPLAKAGTRSYDQRQRDCYDMPSAAACYEVGLNYELGLAREPDLAKAREFYDRACEIGSDEEHCAAAARLRKR